MAEKKSGFHSSEAKPGERVYNVRYCCRQCKSTYTDGTFPQRNAQNHMINLVLQANDLPQHGITSLKMIALHHCFGGSMGIADFAGLELEPENETQT